MTFKRDVRYYAYLDRDNNVEEYRVNYTLYFKDKTLIDIRNEYHCSVQPGSDCWDYFNSKYSK